MNFARIEDELLIRLATPSISAQGSQRIGQLLAQEIQWNYLFGLAYYHGIYPFVYENLKRYNLGGLGEVETKRLKESYVSGLLRNMAFTAELVSILKRLQAANVPAIPLKGPVLTQLIYGDIGLRMFSDLDILVPHDQIGQAMSVLMNDGYQYADNQLARRKRNSEQLFHHYNLSKNAEFSVELHWMLEPPEFSTRENTERFWENTQTIACFDIAITMPKDEEMLLFLCRHGSRHLWQRLKWLCDVAQFLQTHPDLDWQYMQMRMEHSKTKRLSLWAFYLANQLFETTVPEQIAREIEADTTIPALKSQIFERVVPMSAPVRRAEQYLVKQAQLLQLKEGRAARLTYVWGLIRLNLRPNESDYSLIELPDSLAFFYYILHPARLAAKYSAVLIRRLFGRRATKQP